MVSSGVECHVVVETADFCHNYTTLPGGIAVTVTITQECTGYTTLHFRSRTHQGRRGRPQRRRRPSRLPAESARVKYNQGQENTPRSPRATITPSEASTISCRLGTLSKDSILAMISRGAGERAAT